MRAWTITVSGSGTIAIPGPAPVSLTAGSARGNSPRGWWVARSVRLPVLGGGRCVEPVGSGWVALPYQLVLLDASVAEAVDSGLAFEVGVAALDAGLADPLDREGNQAHNPAAPEATTVGRPHLRLDHLHLDHLRIPGTARRHRHPAVDVLAHCEAVQ